MSKKARFIISAAIVIISLYAIDVLVGLAGDYAMNRIPDFSGQLAKNNYRLNRVRTDVLILGSSRASHHYVSDLLKDSLESYTGKPYTVYNAGFDASFVNSNCCAAQSAMDRYQPKLIILEISENELTSDKVEHDLEFSSVNYRNNRFVKQYLDGLGWKERVKLKSNMFRYNLKLLRVTSSFIKKNNPSGYEPLHNVMTVIPDSSTVNDHQVRDPYTIDNLTSVFKTAKDKEIRLVVVTSPRFKPTDSNSFLAALCARYGIPYIDLYNTDIFNTQPQLFQDFEHLNDPGAHLFTKIFFDRLIPYLN